MLKIKTFAIILLLSLLNNTESFSQQATFIFINGKIFTSDTSKLYVTALAIKGDRILAIGNDKTIEKLAGPKTNKVDLEGRTVIPGFNDAHDHLGWLIPVGRSFVTPFSVPGLSKEAVIDSVSRLVKQASKGQWVYGTIGLTVFKDTTIRRKLLDSLSPQNPVLLAIEWGHGMILNTEALHLIHIEDMALDPLGGWYERMAASNKITGALYEGAQFPAWQALTVSEPANLIKALRAHAQEDLVFGITTVQNMSSTLQGNAARRFFKAANLPVKTRIIPMPCTTPNGRSLAEWSNNKPITPFGNTCSLCVIPLDL